MANEEKAEAGGEEASPKKKIPLLLVALGAQFLILVAAGGVMLKATVFAKKVDVSDAVLAERAIASVHDSFNEIQMVDLKEFTVNMADRHTLKVSIQLEVSNPETAKIVERRMPALRANILEILGRHPGQKSDRIQGKLLLKDAIRSALNDELEKEGLAKSGIVRDVYFVDFVMI
jgi:flagellar basal body-associated protein FliL